MEIFRVVVVVWKKGTSTRIKSLGSSYLFLGLYSWAGFRGIQHGALPPASNRTTKNQWTERSIGLNWLANGRYSQTARCGSIIHITTNFYTAQLPHRWSGANLVEHGRFGSNDRSLDQFIYGERWVWFISAVDSNSRWTVLRLSLVHHPIWQDFNSQRIKSKLKLIKEQHQVSSSHNLHHQPSMQIKRPY